MRAWGSNSILRCAENWEHFRNSGFLFRKQWKVLQMPDQQTCTTEYRIPYFLEEFFITEERLKCCQADRPVTWFVWDWVKRWLKKMLVFRRLITSKLQGEHMKLPKGNLHAFPEESKTCPLAHYSCHVISSLIYHCFYKYFSVQLMLFWSTRISTANSFHFWKPVRTFGQGLPIVSSGKNSAWRCQMSYGSQTRKYDATGYNGGLASKLRCSKSNACCQQLNCNGRWRK